MATRPHIVSKRQATLSAKLSSVMHQKTATYDTVSKGYVQEVVELHYGICQEMSTEVRTKMAKHSRGEALMASEKGRPCVCSYLCHVSILSISQINICEQGQ